MTPKECYEYAQQAVNDLQDMSIEEIRERYVEVTETYCREENFSPATMEIFRCLVNYVISEKKDNPHTPSQQ